MDIRELLSRRAFLQKLGALGFFGLSASAVTACGTESEERAAETSDAAGDPCADLSGLSESEIQTRRSVAYVAETPDPETRCDNCQFWLPPEEGEPCGECVTVPGPIHPEGYCNAWAPMSKS